MDPREPHLTTELDPAGIPDVRRRVGRVLALLAVAARATASGELQVRDAEDDTQVASMVVQDGRLHLVRGAGDDGAVHELLRRWSPPTLDVLRRAVYAARTEGRSLETVLAESGARHLEVVRAALEQVLCGQLLELAGRTLGRRLVMPFRPLEKARGVGLAFDPEALYCRVVSRALPPPSGPVAAHYERLRDLAEVAMLVWVDPDAEGVPLPLRFQGFGGMGLSELARVARSVGPVARPPSLLVQGIVPRTTVLALDGATWLCRVGGDLACLTRHTGARAEALLAGQGDAA